MNIPVFSLRLKSVFSRRDHSVLIPFITAGDPDMSMTADILDHLPGAGADIIELGVPFSDPSADGPVIQRSNQRSLANGTNIADILALVSNFRRDHDTPIVLMGYVSPIYSYSNFVPDCAKAGVDGIIVVDLPLEEDQELRLACQQAGIDFIRFTTPTSDDKRLAKIVDGAGGFLYNVAIAGITGTRSAAAKDIAGDISRVRRASNIPIVTGFGIRTPSHVRAIADIVDGIVVGSALIELIEQGIKQGKERQYIIDDMVQLVQELKAATGKVAA